MRADSNLVGTFARYLSAIQTLGADKSNAGRREPPDNEGEHSFSSPERQRCEAFF